MGDLSEASDRLVGSNGNRHGKCIKDYDLRIYTWNIRTLYTPGASNNLENLLVQYKADITAIQEIRWIGSGILKKKKCDIYYSCHKKHHILGCGFVVGNRLRRNVIGFKPINERLAVIRIRAKFYNISLICAHSQTKEAEDFAKENFHDILYKTYGACPRYDAKILLGDFNSKIGREQIFGKTIGTHSLQHTTNDNGFRLIDLAASCNMVISSTYFLHRDIHKGTWLAPDGRTTNQIDHILIDTRHCSSVLDVRTYRGGNIDSDHFLVAARFRAQICNVRKLHTATTRKFNIGNLQSTELAGAFRDRLCEKINSAPLVFTSVNEQWKQYADIMKGVASDTLGYKPPFSRNPWHTEERCNAKLGRHKRNKAKRREEKGVLRRKKRDPAKSQLLDIEKHRDRAEVRSFYRKTKQLSAGFKPYTCALDDGAGNPVTDEEGILRAWKQHFERLLNSENTKSDASTTNTPVNNEEVIPPSLEEVNNAIKKLKNNKAAGSAGRPSEPAALLLNQG
ncbi:craniofacial development protein 2-like [Condylostylus longicornis]|uniref:craniofacial development protein 2-like n=1 Tax=Condylostylus longicornis TaxID=2530218 RepID=UPI00244DC03D|nr:craniofacial development protein 2-like [Condylostylus longicornis]